MITNAQHERLHQFREDLLADLEGRMKKPYMASKEDKEAAVRCLSQIIDNGDGHSAYKVIGDCRMFGMTGMIERLVGKV